MKHPKQAFALLAIVIAIGPGCVPLRYSQYTGTDSSSSFGFGTWPNSHGTMAETSYAVPVYRGWPEKPYVVLGSLSCPDRNANWNDDFFAEAARQAKTHKGDAIIIRQGAEFGVSKIAGSRTDPMVISSSYQTTALVIRWLTPEERAEREALLSDLLKKFELAKQLTSANRNVGELAFVYLTQSGVSLKSPEFGQRFEETLSKILSRNPESLSGDWLYKCEQSASTALSGSDDKLAYGIATVSEEGSTIAIVSTTGNAEINFAGAIAKGKLTGQIGVGGVSAKCEGAATPEKLSLSFQSLTPDGTVRGNVVLQRITRKQNNTPPAHNEKNSTDSGNRSS